MGNLWLKIKVWTKITVFALVLIFLLIFIIENANKSVTIWLWFGHDVETTLLKLIPSLLLVGVVGTLLVRMAGGTLRQLKEIRQQRQATQSQKDLADMHNKAAMLQTRPQNSSAPPP